MNNLKRKTLKNLLWCVFLLPYSLAEASLITFSYDGVISYVSADPGLNKAERAPFEAYIGESVQIEYTFDTETVNKHSDVNRGSYTYISAEYTLSENTYNSIPNNAGNDIWITNNDPFFGDRYDVTAYDPYGDSVGGMSARVFGLTFEDYSNETALSSTNLPSIQPSPADFVDLAELYIIFKDPTSGALVGLYTSDVQISAVPIPAAMWLFISGIITIFGVSRYKKPLC